MHSGSRFLYSNATSRQPLETDFAIDSFYSLQWNLLLIPSIPSNGICY